MESTSVSIKIKLYICLLYILASDLLVQSKAQNVCMGGIFSL